MCESGGNLEQDQSLSSSHNAAADGALDGCQSLTILTPMRKTQIYFPEDELAALHVQARRTGKSVASMVREAVRAVWLRPAAQGPVGL